MKEDEATFLDKIKGFEPAEGIREQLQCNVVMGIHSLNWASMMLELSKATGDEKLRQRANQLILLHASGIGKHDHHLAPLEHGFEVNVAIDRGTGNSPDDILRPEFDRADAYGHTPADHIILCQVNWITRLWIAQPGCPHQLPVEPARRLTCPGIERCLPARWNPIKVFPGVRRKKVRCLHRKLIFPACRG